MSEQVKGPAIGLMVVAGLGVVTAIFSILMNVLGTGMGAMAGGDDAMMQIFSGVGAIVSSIIGIVVYLVVFFGALKMMKLQSYAFSMAAAILAMLPCTCCCIIGLPIGIWALVVLMKPEVKAAFQG